MKRIIFFSIIVFFLSSCATSTYISKDQVPSKGIKKIDIFFDKEQPQKEYQVLGYINSSGWIFTSEKQLLKSIQKKANKINADGIVSVKYSYIPHLLIGIPQCEGVLIKYK